MIRQAKLLDIPKLVELGRVSVEGVLIDPDYFFRTLIDLIRGGIVVVYEEDSEVRGTIGAAIRSDPLTGVKMAQELFWFIARGERRGVVWSKLLLKLEALSVSAGCEKVRITHRVSTVTGSLRRYYKNRGYFHVESCYTLEV